MRLESFPILVGGALALVQLAAPGIFYAKTKDLTDLGVVLILGPGVNLCWLIICSAYLFIDGLYCDTERPLSFYVGITYGYAVVIPAIIDFYLALICVELNAMMVKTEQTV